MLACGGRATVFVRPVFVGRLSTFKVYVLLACLAARAMSLLSTKRRLACGGRVAVFVSPVFVGRLSTFCFYVLLVGSAV